MQLRQLKTFLAAAQTLNFTRAAARVHLSQPSVTEQIHALEDHLGQPLFLRQHNRLALTPAGLRLVPHAQRLLAAAQEALDDMRGGTGVPRTLRIAAPGAVGQRLVAPLLAPFAAQFSGLTLELQTLNSAATAQGVAQGQVDIGVLHGWPASARGLQVEAVARDVPVVVFQPGHRLAGQHAVTLRELQAERIVATAPGCAYRAYLDAAVQSWPAPPQLSATADSVELLLDLVAQGLGVCLLPSLAVGTPARERGLAWRRVSGGEGEGGLPVCVLTPSGAGPTGAALLFIERLRSAASHQAVPAFDMQHAAGGVAVAHQEDESLCDVVRGADATDGQGAGHAVE
jgi:DNA-binding transcriptional LysR family regulator